MTSIFSRRVWIFLSAVSVCAVASAVESTPASFFAKHCTECHDKDTKKGNLDLAALKADFADTENFARWVKVHDRIAAGEMPPKKAARPPRCGHAPSPSARSSRCL
ncbi:MAG: hypothetical protein EB082_09930, partial [Verrucomicrobia bacterium]|nr:hypothetical protein [Verrucomicrobiota bacterium]